MGGGGEGVRGGKQELIVVSNKTDHSSATSPSPGSQRQGGEGGVRGGIAGGRPSRHQRLTALFTLARLLPAPSLLAPVSPVQRREG